MLVFIYPPGNARSHGTHVTFNGRSWKIIGHSKVPANGEGGYVDRSPEVVARPRKMINMKLKERVRKLLLFFLGGTLLFVRG